MQPNHTQGHHGCDNRIECQCYAEGYKWKYYPLHHAAYDDRFGIAEYILECVELDAQSNAEHYECQDDVYKSHLTLTQIGIKGIQNL